MCCAEVLRRHPPHVGGAARVHCVVELCQAGGHVDVLPIIGGVVWTETVSGRGAASGTIGHGNRLRYLDGPEGSPLRVRLAGANVVYGLLFDEGQHVVEPAAILLLGEALVGLADPPCAIAAGPEPARGKEAQLGLVVQHAHAQLLQVVAALHPPRRFPRRLHRRQQQCD